MARVFIAVSRPASQPPDEEGVDIQTPQRTAINSPSHTTLFMPARLSLPQDVLGGTSIKVVSVPLKEGDTRGLPATTLVLNEESGGVDAVVNARELTSLRNAAGSLLSTTLVGVDKPERIVMFGAGKQIEAHINVFLKHYPSINSCTIVNHSLNERARALYESTTASFTGVNFQLLSQQSEVAIHEAVQKADIIICATSATSPLFPSSWVSSGAHVILIGSYKPHMQEVEGALVQRAIPPARPIVGERINQALIVDSREACMTEAGDLIQARVEPTSIVEIGELLLQDKGQGIRPQPSSGARKGSVLSINPEPFTGPITMFKSVGVGLQDVVIAKEVVSHATNMPGVGTLIEGYDTMS